MKRLRFRREIKNGLLKMNVRLTENWMKHPKNKNAPLGKENFLEGGEWNNHKFIKYIALANKSRLGFKEIWEFYSFIIVCVSI